MPVTVGSTMPRRGRRTVLETDLDSVWGDKDITSPTDHVQPWQGGDGVLELHIPYNTYLDHQGKRSATTARSAAVRPATNTTPSLSARPEFERTFDNTVKTATSRPRPGGRSHSQSRVEPSRSNMAPFEQVTPPTETSRARPVSSIWTKEDYFRYISAFNANGMPNGMISPPITEFDEVPAQSYVAAPVHAQSHDRYSTETMSPARYTPPSEHSTVIVRPKPIRPFTPEDLLHHSDRQTYQPSSNHFTLESMRSPLVTVLSPVKESFGVDGGEKSNDDIVVVDEKDVLPNISSRLSSPRQVPANVEQTDSVTPTARHTNTYAPLSTHPSTRAARPSTQHLPSLSISTTVEARGKIGMGIDFGDVQSFPRSSAEYKSLGESQFKTPPIPARSTLRNQPVSAGPQAGHSSYQITSPQTKTTTPLSVTSCMRMQFPSMGASQSVQKPSPPVDTSRHVLLHRKSPSQAEIDHKRFSPPTLGHKRSVSVEQLPSPSMLEPPVQPEAGPEESRKAPQQSLDKETLELIVNAVMQRAKAEGTLMKVSDAAHYARRQTSEDLDTLRKQPPTTQLVSGPEEARPRPAASIVGQLDADVQYKNIPNSTFYNEVRDDYRGLSREAWGTTEVDKSVQTSVATTLHEEKQRPRIRARSSSRPRDRLAIHEGWSGAVQPQMVPTYSQIWL